MTVKLPLPAETMHDLDLDVQIVHFRNQKTGFFARIIQETTPHIVSMENVPELSTQTVFRDFVNVLQELDYNVNWNVVYCPEYGVPQNRKRLVLLASRLGQITLMQPLYNQNSTYTVFRIERHNIFSYDISYVLTYKLRIVIFFISESADVIYFKWVIIWMSLRCFRIMFACTVFV